MASLFFLSNPPQLFVDKRKDKLVIVDSGGFSARVAYKHIRLRDYIKFLDRFRHKSFNGKMFRCFNLDSNDLKESQENQKKLESLGYKPIPVYHFSEYASDHRDIFEDMVRDYDFIGIGGVAGMMLKKEQKKAYLDYVFYRARDKVKIHGLGMSSIKPVENYPFYSVDSSTWLQFQKFAASRAIPNEIMRKWMARHIHYEQRNQLEILWYLKFEHYITRLWARRGVKWDDYDEIVTNGYDFDKLSRTIGGEKFYRYNPEDRRFDEPKKVILK